MNARDMVNRKREFSMPEIVKISIKSFTGLMITAQDEKKFIDQFKCQLKKAAELIGKPAFEHEITINIVSSLDCRFDSEARILTFPKCFFTNSSDFVGNIAHEVVHVIVGNADGIPMDKALVMEEGLSAYNAWRNGGYDYPKDERGKRYLYARCIIDDAMNNVENLFNKWRNYNGEAPVIQKLKKECLAKWGLNPALLDKLLEPFYV
jgi:hypothetical protein